MVERVNARGLGDAKNRIAFGVNAPLGMCTLVEVRACDWWSRGEAGLTRLLDEYRVVAPVRAVE